MTTHTITRDEVVDRSKALPGFPLVISRILGTLNDSKANMSVLVGYIEHDPAIAARILSLANVAATRTHFISNIRDIYTATSLIGMSQVRKIVLTSSIAGFIGKIPPNKIPPAFWQHSVAASVCGEELAHHTLSTELAEAALTAGLLHDIGQLWLYSFKTEPFREVWSRALTQNIGIEDAESECFGVDHATIGAWLAEYWSLPAGIRAAIRHHHTLDSGLAEPLVPLVHVAEVLSNALELADCDKNRVTTISTRACRALSLPWNADARQLFGRIEARSRHANVLFRSLS